MTNTQTKLLALESRRCAAISAGDIDVLKAMLSDDYVHVHMTGRVDNRDGHLNAVSSRPRRTTRGELNIRVYGDLAVLTGELTNFMQTRDGQTNEVVAFCHEVAARINGAWQFIAIQLTPLTARKG